MQISQRLFYPLILAIVAKGFIQQSTSHVDEDEGNPSTTILYKEIHPNCTYPDYYCNPTANNLIKKVDNIPIQDASTCSDICNKYENDQPMIKS